VNKVYFRILSGYERLLVSGSVPPQWRQINIFGFIRFFTDFWRLRIYIIYARACRFTFLGNGRLDNVVLVGFSFIYFSKWIILFIFAIAFTWMPWFKVV